MKITVGTCAWTYDDWRGVFYPEHLAANRRLEFYAQYFNAVEVDATFYHAPSRQAAAHWCEVTPPDFTFTCKMPREITHEHRLRESTGILGQFLHSIEPLRSKLGCVLIQLPPSFAVKNDEAALRDFLQELPLDWRFAVEFRRHEWHLPRIAHLLEEHRIAWAWSDLTPLSRQAEGALEFFPETADFAYIRLMGDLGTKYRADGTRTHRYRELQWPRDSSLANWAARIRESLPRLQRTFLLVSNHFEGFAPHTCARLAERLEIPLQLPSAESRLEKSEEDDRQMDLF
jgi:uncharacterized protein YecE (DUF72 family)